MRFLDYRLQLQRLLPITAYYVEFWESEEFILTKLYTSAIHIDMYMQGKPWWEATRLYLCTLQA